MKIFKRIIIALLVLVLLVAVGGYIYLQTLKPSYSGEFNLNNLNEIVEVKYDTYGIPHIEANNVEDAYRALGYVHAQDRLWQMELMRRIAPGRLSEMFGPDLTETDKFFKTVGIHRVAEKEAARFDAIPNEELKSAVKAYIDGINQFMDNGPTPVEFLLLGLEKQHYTIEDIYNVMGYIAFSFAEAQKSDPIVTQIYKNLGEEYMLDLDIIPTGKTEMIKNHPRSAVLDSLTAKVNSVMNNLPAPAWLGSNSWVVSPEKSATGGVIFANDPHMGFSQPGVWFEAHIKTPTFERYGYHAALIPFALLLHNRNYAIGLTMFENDDIDFYQEKTNPENENQYLYNDAWKTYSTRQETMNVKDGKPINLTIKETGHGPVMNEVVGTLSEDDPVTLWWVYTQLENESMTALYELNHSKDIDGARSGASKIKAPGLNVMYGDKEGNIAWWASAKLHLTADHVNRNLILDGTTSNDEPTEWLPFEENPQSENPPWNYVYSTNNQTDTIKGGLYPGYYAGEDRAQRLVDLLEAKEKLSIDDYKNMLLDGQSDVAVKITKTFIEQIDAESELEEKAKNILADWTGNHEVDETAPVIYQKILFHSMRLAMENKLDSGLFVGFVNSHLMKRTFDRLMHNDSSKWWDDPSTAEVESRKDVFNKAFDISLEELTAQLGDIKDWKWGKVHTFELPHAMGKVEALRPYLNVGTYEMDASDAVLNKLAFQRNGTGVYNITSGPSSRRIINFADIENSLSIIPAGQSGNPLSPHYKDQVEMYTQGKWRKMLMNPQEISEKTINKLTLKPGEN
ncbi:penicillin acylase family protein [Fulvivirga lutimaris]|uniref:penicillin acylase family protein n=1 Tax=Fulvivirga lutimaris TaxID=1819566 RepID=UPI0012BC45BC|nr:penicillin acylase family protein [Fulvivirga lutimaris]MTI39870.1 penicillin acylase family protein [Fulvivirga lutimaris]